MTTGKKLDVRSQLLSFSVILVCNLCLNVLGNNSQTSPRGSHTASFGEPIQNLTVAVGREAVFSCVIHNIKDLQVAWFHKERHTLLALQDRVITKNHRIKVTNQGPSTFSLHITDVRPEDQGTYSCQVNSSPMKSQSGHLEVVVPSRFVEHLTSSDVDSPEDSSVSLRCVANGFPMPEIKWRREDGQPINIRSGPVVTEEKVVSIAGEYLNISKVQRLDSGAYICIASNGIPPATSKRIFLGVTFSPMIWTPKQTLAAPIGVDVVLECVLESYPQPVTFWSKANGPQIIVSNAKYDTSISNIPSVMYKSLMRLRIRELEKKDLGSYSCLAKNSMGETKGTIRVVEGPPDRTSTYTSTTSSSSPNSWNDNEGSHSTKRSKYFHTKTDKENRKLFGQESNGGYKIRDPDSLDKSGLNEPVSKRSRSSSSSSSSSDVFSLSHKVLITMTLVVYPKLRYLY